MDKKKKQLIITGVLVVVMIILMGRNLLPKSKGGARKASAAAIASGVSTEVMTANMTFLAMVRQNESARLLQEAYWEKPWGRDPFALSLSKGGFTETASEFVLSGIVWDERMPVAIINQKLTKTDDTVDGCQVQEIRRSSVIIVCDGKTLELRLFKAQEPAAPAGDKQAPL